MPLTIFGILEGPRYNYEMNVRSEGVRVFTPSDNNVPARRIDAGIDSLYRLTSAQWDVNEMSELLVMNRNTLLLVGSFLFHCL
jgi:hypothetical protein